jgi:hypothetical protein
VSRIGRPAVAAIVATALVVGGLAGALIATGGNDVALPETTAIPAARQTSSAERTTTAVPLESDDAPLGRAETRRVGAAAVAAAGGGTAIEVDRSDDPGEAYEVEVMTDRGEVDVALDDNLRRVENVPYDD